MSKALTDEREMQLIYDCAKSVYEGKMSTKYAIAYLADKVSSTKSSIKMYFTIYAYMRKAKCYKMGTGEAFTKYLLDRIFQDEGKVTYLKALSAVKGNYDYRASVQNTQTSIIRACKESIKKCCPDIDFNTIISSFSPNEMNEDYGVMIQDMGDYEMDDTSTTYLSESDTVPEGDVFELNIQPGAGILNVFSRLSYKIWYAIAEFVDNSTQSYLSHQSELEACEDFDELIVSIRYDSAKNTLTVIDNAYGMEYDRFKDAILLDSHNEAQTGRNEFGMGLKTAASWFGNVWSVTSTQLGSKNQYEATVDIPKLKDEGLNSIQIHRENVEKNSHGTTIVISQITKKLTAPRTIGKIRDLLSSMYRRDINKRNIEIQFNGEPIYFDEYPVLKNFRGKSWKKELDFVVDFGGKKYHVTGFVAIMNPGSFSKAGFALFRQDRVVIGGSDCNYKPFSIFGQAQSQKSLKLFGELNMNDFPVNQAKDGFIWDDGLEDAFLNELKSNIQDYIDIAELSIKEREQESSYTPEASNKLQEEVSQILENAFGSDDVEKESQMTLPSEASEKVTDKQEYVNTVLNAGVEEKQVSTPREYIIPISAIIKVKISVQWSVGSKSWIEYNETEPDKFFVQINIDHPFFLPFSKDDRFKLVLEKFAIAFVLAEREAKLSSDKDGYIRYGTIRNCMNKYLRKLSEENNGTI